LENFEELLNVDSKYETKEGTGKKKKGPTDFLSALVEVQIFLTCIYFKPLLTNAAGAAVHAKDTKLTMNIAQSCTTTTTHGSSTLLRS